MEEIYAYRNHLRGARLTQPQWRTLARNPGSGDFQTANAQLGRALLARQDELVQQVLSSHVTGF